MPSCSSLPSEASEPVQVAACLAQPQSEEGSRECMFSCDCKVLRHNCLSISNLEVWH